LLSCDKLFEIGEKVYFWTFTFKKVHCDWQYAYAWREFIRDLSNMYGGYLCGVRVIEPHKEHGLHYHALINRRIPVQLVRMIGAKYGFGRCHVVRANPHTSNYLAKYLTKDAPKMYGGIHRWGTIGAFRGVRKNDIVIESNYMKARRKLDINGRLKFGVEQLLMSSYDVHGEEGLKQCWAFLKAGRQMMATMMVSPNVRLTNNGGLVYLKNPKGLKARIVRSGGPYRN